MNVLQALAAHAATFPGQPAIALPDRVITFGMVEAGAKGVEARLRMAGVQPRSVVVISVSNPAWDLIVSLAAMRLGAVSTSMDVANQAAIAVIDPEWFIVDHIEDAPGAGRALVIDETWFRSAAPTQAAYAFHPDETCRIMFSSGSTGAPRAVAFTPRILADRLYTWIMINQLGHSHRLLIGPQLGSTLGWITALSVLTAGGLVLFGVTPEASVQMIDVYGADAILLTAHQTTALLDSKLRGGMTTQSLRTIQIGGGQVSDSMADRMRGAFANTIICRYGTTEVGVAAFARQEALSGKPGAVGFVAPWVEIEIVDEDGTPVNAGSAGALRIRTSLIAREWSRDEFYFPPDDGWFEPGDIARVEANGLLIVEGRSTNLLNVGGVKISAEQVEREIRNHDGIVDAAASSFISPSGVDELYCLVVAPDRAVEDLPRKIGAVFPGGLAIKHAFAVAHIPRNANGKIMRAEVRAVLAARLAGQT